MTTSFKKALLLGTALVAVGATNVNAADLSTAASATWASAGTRTSATVATAAAGDNVNIITGAATLTITNDGTASDTAAAVNAFILGNVTDSSSGDGTIVVTTGAAPDMTATIASVDIDEDFTIAGLDANDAHITVTITNGLSLGDDISITTTEADAAFDNSLTVGGNTTVTGTTALTAGGFAGSDATLTLNGASNTLTGAVTVTAATAATAANLVLTGASNTFTGGVNLVTASRSTMTISGAKAQTITGALSGSGVLAVSTANTDATIATASTVGTSTVAASTTLRFSNDTTSTTSITNNGNVYVAAGKVLTSGSFLGTTGTYNLAVSDADGTLAAADFGRLASGSAIDLANERIAFNVTGRLGAATTGTLIGTVFNGGSAAVNTASLADVTDNSALYNFQLVLNTNEHDVLVTKVSEASAITTSANNDNVVTILDSTNAAVLADTAELETVLNSVLSSSTAAVMNERAEATLPSVDAGAVSAVVDVAAQAVGVTDVRLASLRSGDTGMVAGDMSHGASVWMQGFGKLADQDADDGVDGYEADTYGVAVGVDSSDIMDDAVVGLSVAYAITDVESDNANQTESDIDSYQVSLYGEHDLGNAAFLNATLAYAHNSIDQKRFDVGGTTLDADADYDSNQYVVKAELGRELALADGMTFTPSTLVNFQHVSIDDYRETGAGTAGLNVETDSINVLELGVGGELAWTAVDVEGGMLRPAVDFGYRYDVIGDEVEASSTFIGGGAAFKTTGSEPDQGKFNIGASLAYDMDAASVKVSYDYEMKGEDYSAHAGFVRAGYKF